MPTNLAAWTIDDTIRHAIGTEDVELIPFDKYVLLRSKALPEYAFIMKTNPGRGIQALMTFRLKESAPEGTPTTYETACGCCQSHGKRKLFKKQLYKACMEHGIRCVFLRKAHELAARTLDDEEQIVWGNDGVRRTEDEHEQVTHISTVRDDRFVWRPHHPRDLDPKKIVVNEAMYFRKEPEEEMMLAGFPYDLEGIRKAFAFVKSIDRDNSNN